MGLTWDYSVLKMTSASVATEKPALPILVFVLIAATYAGMFSCSRNVGVALGLMEIWVRTLQFAACSVDLLLPLVQKKRSQEFFAELQRNETDSERRPVQLIMVLTLNILGVIMQVAVLLLMHGFVFWCEGFALIDCACSSLRFIRIYTVVLVISQKVRSLNRKLSNEILGSSIFQLYKREPTMKYLSRYDGVLDSIQTFGELFGLQISLLCLIFQSIIIQDVVVIQKKWTEFPNMTMAYLILRTTIMAVRSHAHFLLFQQTRSIAIQGDSCKETQYLYNF